MENKRLRVFAILIGIGFVLIVNVAFFGAQSSVIEDWTGKLTIGINYLEYKVDSLEKVVNVGFKNRRDTIILDIRPQTIKIYQPNGNSTSNNTNSVSVPR